MITVWLLMCYNEFDYHPYVAAVYDSKKAAMDWLNSYTEKDELRGTWSKGHYYYFLEEWALEG